MKKIIVALTIIVGLLFIGPSLLLTPERLLSELTAVSGGEALGIRSSISIEGFEEYQIYFSYSNKEEHRFKIEVKAFGEQSMMTLKGLFKDGQLYVKPLGQEVIYTYKDANIQQLLDGEILSEESVNEWVYQSSSWEKQQIQTKRTPISVWAKRYNYLMDNDLGVQDISFIVAPWSKIFIMENTINIGDFTLLTHTELDKDLELDGFEIKGEIIPLDTVKNLISEGGLQ